MMEHVIAASQINLDYARKLLADVPDEQMCVQPRPGMNHAAWQLGHLAFVFDSMLRVFGQPPTFPAEWVDLFKVGSQPHDDRAKYPSKEALLAEYEKNYRRFVETAKTASDEALAAEFPNPKIRWLLPTVGVAVVHVLTTHQGVHLGQLSAWRRALGMGGVLL